MMTSACGPAAIASATADVTGPPMATIAAERRLRVALERPLVGGDEVVGHGRPARVGVLEMMATAGGPGVGRRARGPAATRRRRRRCSGSESALPPCWTTSSHQRRLPGDPVAGAVLVRVLAVAEDLGPLQRQVDRRRQHAGPPAVRDRRAVPCTVPGRPPPSNQATMAAS